MTDLLKNLKDVIEYNNVKQKIISRNIANANIPNAKSLTLKEFTLKNAKNNLPKINIAQTSKLHLRGRELDDLKFKIIETPNLETSINGNNIDLVIESQEMLKTSSDNKINIEVYKKVNSMMKACLSSK